MAVTKEEYEDVNKNVPMEWVFRYYNVDKGDGGRYHCPFGTHQDRHASLSIHKEKNFCKCFACNESANPVSFVSKMDGIPADQACIKLEEEYGIKEFEGQRYKEKNWKYDVRNILPLSASDLRFIGLEPHGRIYEITAEQSEELQEELETIKKDYEEGYGRHDVDLHTLQKWTDNAYLYHGYHSYSMLDDWKENPETITEMIQGKIFEKYAHLSSLPITGERELQRERLEKLQDRIEKLVHNVKYQGWLQEIKAKNEKNEEVLEAEPFEKDNVEERA